ETTPPAAGPAATRDAVDVVARGRRRRGRRRNVVVAVLAALLVATFAVTLMVGQTFYGPGEVTSVILGEQVSGASFTVGRLRLPRATLGVLTGLCFGLGGVTFQTMLRNQLASPDIIGISSGASAAAACAIVFWSLSGAQVSWSRSSPLWACRCSSTPCPSAGARPGRDSSWWVSGWPRCWTRSPPTSSRGRPSGTCRRRCDGSPGA